MLPGKMLTETPRISLPFVIGTLYMTSSCCILLFDGRIPLSLAALDSALATSLMVGHPRHFTYGRSHVHLKYVNHIKVKRQFLK
jgi:hypothetical protein